MTARRTSRRRGDRSEFGTHEGDHIEQLAPGCHSQVIGRLRMANLRARLEALDQKSTTAIRSQVADLRELAERTSRRRHLPRAQVDALFRRLLSLEQDYPSRSPASATDETDGPAQLGLIGLQR